MKKGTKAALWISIGCVVLGMILVMAGKAAGGYAQLERVNKNMLGLAFRGFGMSWNYENFDTDAPKNGESTQTFAVRGLRELEVHAELHSISIIEDDVEEIRVEGADCGEISCFVKEDTLVLRDSGKVRATAEPEDHVITLVVPRDFAWSKVEISTDLGNVEMHGVVERELDAECNLGNISLYLQQKKEDFNYRIEGLGNVEIDDVSYGGQGKETRIDHNAPRDMEIEVSLGNIEISFE